MLDMTMIMTYPSPSALVRFRFSVITEHANQRAQQTKIELLLKMGSGADDGRDHVFGGLCNKIPGRLRRSTAFLISIPLLRKRASGCKQKIPFLRDAQEEDFIEVGGGL